MDSPLLKAAKECATKQSWEAFFTQHSNDLVQPSASKVLPEIFKILQADEQSLQYSNEIWVTLLDGALACWNIDLANLIADHVRHVTSAKIALRIARVHAESGQPLKARCSANRALRLSQLALKDRLQLEMTVCQSFVDEGKRNMAIRQSNKMEITLQDASLNETEKGQFLQQLGRINFFLGRYPQAGKLFFEAFEAFKKTENWYEAARSVYNAGSSYFSAGGKLQEPAFRHIEECRRISEAHQLQGPLSHVEAFYGHDDYWHGDFAGARDHYRRAHKYIPSSDKSFRTLHVLSMLTFIYLRTGQWTQAKKFGDKTLELAVHDQSERFRSRYHNLKAELMWERGDIASSHQFLREHVEVLLQRGVNTLEELSTLSRYLWQCSKIGEDPSHQKFQISEQLKKNTGDWVEYLHASAKLHLACGRLQTARQEFEDCLYRSKAYGDKYHTSLSMLGMIQLNLLEKIDLRAIEQQLSDFEVSLARLVETPIKIHVHFIRAAIAYRGAKFEDVVFHLKAASSFQRVTFCDRLVLDAWLATVSGHSFRIHSAIERAMISGMTRIYFSPRFEMTGEGQFIVSGSYVVDLSKHPALDKILHYLLCRNRFAANPEDLQTEVWNQSLAQQGWRQKIRNAIARIRELFPFTMAPLILHDDGIALNHEAIRCHPIIRKDVDNREEILRLLREGPMSTVSLSNRLKISTATTKRILQKLSQEDQITVIKMGKQVTYQAFVDNESGLH